MKRRTALFGGAGIAAAVAGAFWLRARRAGPPALTPAELTTRQNQPLTPPAGALAVYHLGHSLVGRDMPAMLAQLAGPGHRYASQLGWGASLRQHWEPSEPVPGFAEENAHPAFRAAQDAIGSGTFDAVVLTEMVEIRDAIRYHDSGRYLAHWARAAHAANPATRVYLYETWHRLDDPEGWLARLDADLAGAWESILRSAMAYDGVGMIHLIPAGQAMAALVRAIEAGALPGVSRREDLFARTPDGAQDMIHMNDLGAYFVALVHYAALYHRSPEGLPHALLRADGAPATPPAPDVARVMQKVAWQVVAGYAGTGIAPPG